MEDLKIKIRNILKGHGLNYPEEIIDGLERIFHTRLSDDIEAQKEEYFRSLYESSPDAILLANRKTGVIVDANQAAADLFEMDRGDIIGRKQTELHPREQASKAIDGFHHRPDAVNEKPPPFQIDILTSKKKKKTVEITGVVLILDDEEYILGSFRDISDRIGVKAALKESEEKLKEVLNSVSEAIVIHDDKTGQIIDCNDATVKMYGYDSKDELLGLSVKEVSSIKNGFDQNEIINQIKKAEKDRTYSFEWLAKKKDGETFWVEVSLKKTFIGGEGRMLAVARDISERKKAEENLSDYYNKLKEAQEIAQLGYWDYDIVNNELFWSDEIYRIFNCDPEDFKCTYGSFLDFIHPEDREKVDKAYSDSIINKKPYEITHRILLKDGKIKYVKEKCNTFYNKDGKPLKSRGIVLDITQLKEQEIKISEYAKRLEQANETKDKFFSIISHDLRSPLSGIKSLSEDYVKNYRNIPILEIFNIIKAINESSSNLIKLLENLLQWSRINQGEINYLPMKLNLHDFADEVIVLMKDSIESKNLKCSNNISKEINVVADKSMTQLIFRNIIGNAIKFTDKDGMIKINAKPLSDDFVQIEIEDNGTGIHEDKMDQLFHIDKIKSTPGTEGEKGTGLGLILCKEFIEKHGGKIWIESKVNKGSKFSFSLPAWNNQ